MVSDSSHVTHWNNHTRCHEYGISRLDMGRVSYVSMCIYVVAVVSLPGAYLRRALIEGTCHNRIVFHPKVYTVDRLDTFCS